MDATDRAKALLAELAELGMGYVRRLHDAGEGVTDTATLVALTEAFCDVSRGVRQSIALHLRIDSGGFAVRAAPAADPDAEPEERPERIERGEYWNEYERPDYETPLRLTGDPAVDEPAIQQAVEAAVTRIRRSYAKAEAVLQPGASAPRGRAALLAGTAPLRPVDSS